jgi:glycine/D-amino acid oxidase-like deaminating enzyme
MLLLQNVSRLHAGVSLGGGIIGCTTAYYLTRHPLYDPFQHAITIIEAAKIANGASSKAGGLLASWASPGNLAALSFDLHGQLATEHNGADLWGYRRVRCGQLTAVGRPPKKNENQRYHPEVEVYSEAEAEASSQSNSTIQLGKWWRRDQMSGSVLPDDLDWFKEDSAQSYEEFADTSSTAQVHPFQFTANIAKLAEQAGARIVIGTVEHVNCSDRESTSGDSAPLAACRDWSQKKVVSITYTDKVTTERRTIPAAAVVLAAGPWTPTLLPQLRMSPLRAHSISIKVKRPVSAYCLFTEITFRVPSQPATHGELSKSSSAKTVSPEIYSRPNNEVYICSQGDLNVPLPHPTEVVAVSARSCQEIIDAAASVSDDLASGHVTGRRACYLPTIEAGVTKDPLVGYSGLEGLLLATGHSCWGISNAPGTGKVISELIFDGEAHCIPVGNLDPRKIFLGKNAVNPHIL